MTMSVSGSKFFDDFPSLAAKWPVTGESMADIFISYASQDRAVAEKLAGVLEGEGWSVWWDRTILPGKSFARMIEDALDASKCVVVLWSETSRDSDWVQNEARFGHERHALIPALIEDLKPPFEFRHIHAASLIDWQGDAANHGYRQLVAAISHHAGPPPKLEEEAARKKAQEEEARRKAEEEAKAAAEEAKRQAEEEEDARRKAEAEAKRRAEEAERRKAEEQEARRKAEEGAARKKAEAEAEAKRKAKEDGAREKVETDKPPAGIPTAEQPEAKKAKVKWMAAAAVLFLVAGGIGVALYQRSFQQDRIVAEQEDARKARVEAQRKAEEEAQRKAEEEANRKAEEQEAARKQAEEGEARRQAELVIEALDKEMNALSNVNVREGPGVEYGKASTLTRGTAVRVTGHTDDWYRVALADGEEGFVFKELLGERTATDTLQLADRFRDCDVCPEMVVVPAGSFLMGLPSDEARRGRDTDKRPQYGVNILKAFAVGVYEVTFAEWDACVDAGGCSSYRPADESWGRGRRPAVNVSWNDARAYVKWLSGKTGEDYRLLTEAEWEYVARAGTTTPFSFGSTISTDQANYNGDYTYKGGSKGEYRGKTMPVGSFRANAFGLHDVHGNVWEWVADCYEEDAYKTHGFYPAMVGSWQQSCNRVLRGGSWYSNPWSLRSADRSRKSPGYRNDNVGFRVARTL